MFSSGLKRKFSFGMLLRINFNHQMVIERKPSPVTAVLGFAVSKVARKIFDFRGKTFAVFTPKQ
jgi:hypothetical protein